MFYLFYTSLYPLTPYSQGTIMWGPLMIKYNDNISLV